MILVWGLSDDSPTAAVIAALERSGNFVFFLDQHEVLNTGLDLWINEGVHGVMRSRTGDIDLDQIGGVYLRPYASSRLPGIAGAPPAAIARASAFDDGMLCWSELTSARVVNRPSAMASNFSKPYQLSLIRAAGFATPATLVTTDPGAVLDFEKHHGALIYKSVSGVRSVVSRLGAEHLDRLSDVAACPTQFQAYVDGDDYRVHVVGSRLFATRIRCAATDYRYASRSR